MMHRPIITWGSALLFFVVAIVLVFMFFRLQHIASSHEKVVREVQALTHNNHQVLCTFRKDLVARVNAEKDFLRDNPNGIPGIKSDAVRVSIMNQERTLKAFRQLNC